MVALFGYRHSIKEIPELGREAFDDINTFIIEGVESGSLEPKELYVAFESTKDIAKTLAMRRALGTRLEPYVGLLDDIDLLHRRVVQFGGAEPNRLQWSESIKTSILKAVRSIDD